MARMPKQPGVVKMGFGGLNACKLLKKIRAGQVKIETSHVIIYLGGNDMGRPEYLAPAAVIGRLQQVHDALRAANPGIQVICQSELAPRPEVNWRILNTLITSHFPDVMRVAMYMVRRNGTPRDGMLSSKDFIHLAPKGDAKMMAAVRLYRLRVMPKRDGPGRV